MTDNDRKRLTEFLGECWHETIRINTIDGAILNECQECLVTFGRNRQIHRTFTTWDDLGAVKERLVEKGMWEKFEDYTDDCRIDALYDDENFSKKYYSLTDWLMHPARFCELAAEFLKEKK